MKVIELKPGVRPEILDPDTTLIRINEVMAKTGLARSTIYKKMQSDDTFPKPVKMEDTRSATVCFVLGEVQEWVRIQISKARSDDEA